MEIDINDCIAKIKAYKQYLRDKLEKIANEYTYEDFKQELNEWNGSKFIDWADRNNLDVVFNDDTKEIGLQDRTDNDICIMVRCKVSMAETMYKAFEQIKKENMQ